MKVTADAICGRCYSAASLVRSILSFDSNTLSRITTWDLLNSVNTLTSLFKPFESKIYLSVLPTCVPSLAILVTSSTKLPQHLRVWLL